MSITKDEFKAEILREFPGTNPETLRITEWFGDWKASLWAVEDSAICVQVTYHSATSRWTIWGDLRCATLKDAKARAFRNMKGTVSRAQLQWNVLCKTAGEPPNGP